MIKDLAAIVLVFLIMALVTSCDTKHGLSWTLDGVKHTLVINNP